MNPAYFGDSYDIVKRFFCSELRALGYSVAVVPMLTGTWGSSEAKFYRFIGAEPLANLALNSQPVALLFDPDTGVHHKATRRHLSIQQLAAAAQTHELVFSFDQSFSRQHKPAVAMQGKLAALNLQECHGMYYDSHARFLFAATEVCRIAELRDHLISLGMPPTRLLTSGS
jgi:hypothetical protein